MIKLKHTKTIKGINIVIISMIILSTTSVLPHNNTATHSNNTTNDSSYSSLLSELSNLEDQFPDLINITEIGKTTETRPIAALKLTSNETMNPTKPSVLFIGGIHGKELITATMMFHIIDSLTSSYNRDAHMTKLLEHCNIWIIPCLNPDGYEKTQNGDPWRKNMRDNGDGSFGVDLNRNFGIQVKEYQDSTFHFIPTVLSNLSGILLPCTIIHCR